VKDTYKFGALGAAIYGSLYFRHFTLLLSVTASVFELIQFVHT